MTRCFVWAPLAAFLAAGSAGAQVENGKLAAKPVTITVTAGKHDYKNTPVVVPLSLPRELAEGRVVLSSPEARKGKLPGQLTAPGLLTEGERPSAPNLVRRDLHFLVPSLKAGQTVTFNGLITAIAGQKDFSDPEHAFRWVEVPNQYAELLYGNRPILRYMDRPYDKSSTQKRDLSYKVFHHLYDPEGKRFVTNGGQTDYPDEPKRKLLYPHHRGLMFAFMKNTYDGKTADTWHAKPGDTHQEHVKFLDVEGGPVLGRHRVAVDWHGPDNKVFATEQREVTVYNVPGGTLVEFASRLQPADGPVKLGGDPQHSGFQFRARNDVADKEIAKQTYYRRPDGKGQPGETRNWDPKTKKGPVNLPWNAMSFVLDGKRYTVAYLDTPTNPREARWSERDYGRFGNYFEYEMTRDHPLVVDYRIWLQDGEMTGPEVQGLSTAFVTPPAVTVK